MSLGPKKPDFDLTTELEFEESAPQLRLQKPKMRHDAKIIPQTFRGKTYHVLQDPINLQFYRVQDAEREIIEQLKGEVTLQQIHDGLRSKFGGQAPSFRELVTFVVMLRHANLTEPDEAEEARWGVERARKKRQQKAKQKFASFMYVTIPLLDPERFLNATMPYVRWIFTKPFFIIWLLTIATGLFAFFYNFAALAQPVHGILSPDNLFLLYAGFIFVKTCHEFGHAYAVKNSGGEVHRMGILFLIFMPCWYVDATSVWGFPDKKSKVLVGCNGMMTELFVAALALFTWLNIEPGALRSLLYNVIFVASVSTILFNGNPLLRYDAYYITSDLLEIPNLRQRSTQYVMYLIKRYVIGQRVPPITDPPREKAWLFSYGIAATCYRTFIVVGIILFIASKLFFVGVAMAMVVAVLWVVTPVIKLIKYIFFDKATRPVRLRAVCVFLVFVSVVGFLLGGMPAPHSVRTPCALRPHEEEILRAEEPGFVAEVHVKDGDKVEEGQMLAVLTNEQLDFQIQQQGKLIEQTAVRLRMLETQHLASAQAEAFRLSVLQKNLAKLQERKASMTFRAPFEGHVIAPNLERIEGRFLTEGEPLFMIAALGECKVTAVVDTADITAIKDNQDLTVRIKFRGAPRDVCEGTIERLHPEATHLPPPMGLTNTAGGPVLLDPRDRSGGGRTLYPWYRVDIVLDANAPPLPVGTTGTARFRLGKNPIGKQAWLRFRRMLHRRFLI